MTDYAAIPLDADITVKEYMTWPLEELRARKEPLYKFAMMCDCTPPFTYIPERDPCNHYSSFISAWRSKVYEEIGISHMPVDESDWINRPPYWSSYYAGDE